LYLFVIEALLRNIDKLHDLSPRDFFSFSDKSPKTAKIEN
jgi:hypothetical protein